MAIPKFIKGNVVNFERNEKFKIDNIKIEAIVPRKTNFNRKEINLLSQYYIIESEKGWFPDIQRQQQYGLNPDKKYLFVQEDELQNT